jgi:hypothetical protein
LERRGKRPDAGFFRRAVTGPRVSAVFSLYHDDLDVEFRTVFTGLLIFFLCPSPLHFLDDLPADQYRGQRGNDAEQDFEQAFVSRRTSHERTSFIH